MATTDIQITSEGQRCHGARIAATPNATHTAPKTPMATVWKSGRFGRTAIGTAMSPLNTYNQPRIRPAVTGS